MNAETLTALRIKIRGEVASFRYPFFTQGFQPTFEMPPPSTIYGLLCSAVGDYLPADQIGRLRFGYHFTHEGKFVDYKEHLHFSDPVQPFPFDRQLLFRPSLTLYLVDTPEALEQFASAFREPYYTLVLGRSQDLVSCTAVDRVPLQRVEQGYFENTLLPLDFAPLLYGDITSATMPRYIDPSRRVESAQYALLRGVALYPPPEPEEREEEEEEEEQLSFDLAALPLWCDPFSPPHRSSSSRQRLVYLHTF